MKTFNRFGLYPSAKHIAELWRLGVKSTLKEGIFAAVLADENDVDLNSFLSSEATFLMKQYEFTEKERSSSSFLFMAADWSLGYPFPNGDNEYLDTVFGENGVCGVCGVRLCEQKEPYVAEKKPNWGNEVLGSSLGWMTKFLFWAKLRKIYLIQRDPFRCSIDAPTNFPALGSLNLMYWMWSWIYPG